MFHVICPRVLWGHRHVVAYVCNLYVCTKVKYTAGLIACLSLLMINYFKLEFMLLIIRSNCILTLLKHNINVKVYNPISIHTAIRIVSLFIQFIDILIRI